MKDMKQIKGSTTELSRLQSNLQTWAQSVIKGSFVDGVLLQAVPLLASQTTLVEHKLGRELRGWVPVRLRADSRVWDDQDVNVFKSKSLALKCSSDVIVDLWVF